MTNLAQESDVFEQNSDSTLLTSANSLDILQLWIIHRIIWICVCFQESSILYKGGCVQATMSAYQHEAKNRASKCGHLTFSFDQHPFCINCMVTGVSREYFSSKNFAFCQNYSK